MMRVLIFFKFALLCLIYRVNGILNQEVIIPKSYELKLVPFLENSFNFTGEVNIEIQCTYSTTEILLHCGDFLISTVKVSRNGKEYAADYEIIKKFTLLRITTRDYLAYDDIYNVYIKYSGHLNDDMIGFYRSYHKMSGQKKWLAVTQFESNFARMAFPCFDEPRFRTPFTISVGRYKNQIALSNMPLKETSEEDPSINNRVWDTFQTTPPMSTYLVAVIVSDFASVTSEDRRISVWARPSAIRDANYVVGQCQLILEQLEAYTGIRYPLPKLDLVAVPHFKSGAMENWGLTTYRERYLLYQSEIGSAKHLEVINLIVAHEFSHQWFGDYVTPQWWSYVWLNEAFAEYFKYYIVAAVEPSWRMDQFFVTDVVQAALFADEVNVHHPITTEVKTTVEIQEIFDIVTYHKGSSILRMLEHVISPPTFQKSLRRYLKEGNKNGGTVGPNNLLNAFDEQVLQDKITLPLLPSEIMNTWIKNRGYPLIRVTKVANQSLIIIEQTTYTSPRSDTSIPDQRWIIPLSFTKKYSTNFEVTQPTHWIGLDNSTSLEIKVSLKNDEWILFNKQQIGYYRVNYDMPNWNLLVNQLHTMPENIHILNRAQLLDDSFALAIDEKLSYDVPMSLVTYLDNEFEALPWFTAMKHFNYLYSQFQQTALEDIIKDFFLERIENYYKTIGFQIRASDDHLTRTVRSRLLLIACHLGHPDCILKAKKIYEKFFDDLSKVPGDLKSAVYCTTLTYGNSDSVWDKLWTLYKTTNSAFESEIILSTVGCIKDDKLIIKILEKLIADTNQDIHKQNIIYVQNSLFQTSNGVTITLNFIHNILMKQTELDPITMAKLVAIVKKIKFHITFEDQIKILKKIISEPNQHNKNSTPLMIAFETAYKDGIARITSNKKRVEEMKNAIENCIRPSSITPVPKVKSVTSEKTPSSAASFMSLFWLNAFISGLLIVHYPVIYRTFI